MSAREYIIQTSAHQRWWLPDNIHYIDIRHLNKKLYLKVVDSRSHNTRQEFNMTADHPQREQLRDTFIASAERKYPRNIMARADAHNKATRRNW